MKTKELIIGTIVLIAILGGILIYIQKSNDSELKKLEFDKYAFTQSELNFGTSINSPPAPTPDCQITGIITDVKFIEAYNDSCMYENCPENTITEGCCTTDYNPVHPAMYVIMVYVQEDKSVANLENSELRCEDLFEVGTKQAFYILEDKITEIPKSRLTIKGIIKDPAGIRRFDSYNLEEIIF